MTDHPCVCFHQQPASAGLLRVAEAGTLPSGILSFSRCDRPSLIKFRPPDIGRVVFRDLQRGEPI